MPTQRATIDVVVDGYDALLAEICDALGELAPAAAWSRQREASTSAGDTQVAGDDAVVVRSAQWVLDADFTGTARATALRIVSDAVVRHAFGEVVVFVDRPDEVQVVAADALGAQLRYGSRNVTVVRYTTGSHPRTGRI